MRPRFPTGETLDLGNLPEYWHQVDRLLERIYALPDVPYQNDLTARAFDMAQPAGKRVYYGANRYLDVAVDNHQALLSLFERHGATPWSPWSLLRPIFESAFFATWLLDPPNGRVRRIRGLICELHDQRQKHLHTECFIGYPEIKHAMEESRRKSEAEGGAMWTYRKEAQDLQVAWATVNNKRGVNVFDELPKLTLAGGNSDFTMFLQAAWRTLSGFEHGLGWALIRNSDRAVETPLPGGSLMRMTLNDDALVNTAKMAYALLIEGLRLYERRSTRPD